MIKLHDSNGRKVYLAAVAIMCIREADAYVCSPSIKSYVEKVGGEVIQVVESVDEIHAAMTLQKEPPHA